MKTFHVQYLLAQQVADKNLKAKAEFTITPGF
jgi:hypothetical protein